MLLERLAFTTPAAEPTAVTAADGSYSFTGLAAELPITRQAVAKHLAALKRARLVRARRSGRETRYELDAAALDAVRDWVVAVGAEWDDRLNRLERTLAD